MSRSPCPLPAPQARDATPTGHPSSPALCYPWPVSSFEFENVPELHSPVVIMAFAGWNDAASSATNAARFIVRRLGARRFASLPSEPYYAFTDTRPTVRSSPSGSRVIQWPANEFFYARNPVGPHDVVVGIGVEPNLRWATYASAFAELIARLNADLVVTLGALLADVPHTRPVRVTGSAANPDLADCLNLSRSRYEGPTGIVGIMQQALIAAELPAISFWANVPHYITAAQNPPATVGLLERIEQVVEVPFDYADLRDAGERFEREVSTALGSNAEVQEYVRRLEEAYDAGGDPPGGTSQVNAGDILRDVENFLREQRPDPGDDD
jgi:proteasome assembly chaperone (PAC2) family protein